MTSTSRESQILKELQIKESIRDSFYDIVNTEVRKSLEGIDRDMNMKWMVLLKSCMTLGIYKKDILLADYAETLHADIVRRTSIKGGTGSDPEMVTYVLKEIWDVVFD